MMEWRPIETRPKSGKIIVGWRHGDKNIVAEMDADRLPIEHGWTHWLLVVPDEKFPNIPIPGR